MTQLLVNLHLWEGLVGYWEHCGSEQTPSTPYRRTILVVNTFILCTLYRSNFWTHFRWFYSKLIAFIKKSNIDFPHHTVIEHSAMCWMCRRDSKASTVTSYPLENCVYDGSVLALLSRRYMAWCNYHMVRIITILWWI